MSVFLAALVVSLIMVRAAVPMLVRFGVVDVPNQRSSHRSAMPRGGGVGALVGLFAATALGGALDMSDAWLVLGCVAALALLGLADDLRGLPALVRLAVQIVVCAVAAAGLTGGDAPLKWVLASVVATVWLVGFTNVFNFMDGINGISGLVAGTCGGWYAWLGSQQGDDLVTVLGVALAGCALGFLPWNAVHPRVFLGDVGSYGLGGLIGMLAVLSAVEGADLLSAGSPVLVYLADSGWALVKRLHRREPWREAHREHVYQRLFDAGWGHLPIAVLVACVAGCVCLVVGTLPTLAAVGITVVVLLAYLSLPRWASPRDGRSVPRSAT